MQSEFVKYLRTETKKTSLGVLVLLASTSLILIFLALWKFKDGENSPAMKLVCIQIVIPTVFLMLAVILSRFNEKFTELIGLSLIVPNTVIIFVLRTTDIIELDTPSRDMQGFLLMLFQFFLTFFTPIDYLPHLL